mgnify:FL=1
MKKVYKILFWILLGSVAIYLYLFSGWEQLLFNLIFLNIIVYILRGILAEIAENAIKKLLPRYIFMIFLNIIWLVFVFWLLFVISPTLFVAIISFLVIAISLTFQNVINNIASGLLLLSAEGFKGGDLIETNGVQGRVKEITLNHIKLEEFDGSINYLPNKKVFNASVVKFTHEASLLEDDSQEYEDHKNSILEYFKKAGTILTGGEKLTRYIKVVEIQESIDVHTLGEKLKPVFDKYEKIFGIRPYFYSNHSNVDRLSITLQILTKEPRLILRYLDPYLKDVLFHIYKEDIYLGYESSENPEEVSV